MAAIVHVSQPSLNVNKNSWLALQLGITPLLAEAACLFYPPPPTYKRAKPLPKLSKGCGNKSNSCRKHHLVQLSWPVFGHKLSLLRSTRKTPSPVRPRKLACWKPLVCHGASKSRT